MNDDDSSIPQYYNSLKDVFQNFAIFLTIKELIIMYICNRSFEQLTKDNQQIWRFHCNNFTNYFKIKKLELPIYQNYKTLIKLNNDTLRMAVNTYLKNPHEIELLLGKITYWDTSLVTNMSGMFFGAETFNQPLEWDTSSVTDMSQMFEGAEAFNQPLKFNTSKVTDMSFMFSGAIAFNQSLNWKPIN